MGIASSRSSAGPSAAATPRHGPRQLGAALPHHLGHRARASSSRSSGGCARRVDAGLVELALPAPGRRADRHRRERSTGVRGDVLEPERRRRAGRRARAPRSATSSCARRRSIVTSGGIGGNHDLVRATWPERLGTPPAHDDLGRARARRRADARDHPARPAAASSTRTGCGTTPRASTTGTRSGPSTASGSCPARRRCGSTRPGSACRCRCSPASTPSARWRTSAQTGYDHSWFVPTHKIIEKEFALSGSEQNPDLTGKDVRRVLSRARAGVPARCRRSSTTARTSSSRTTSPSWSPG